MKVSIIGAGFSGLTMAYFLTKKNVQAEIFDEQAQPGGMIRTKFTAQGLVETAANGVWNSELFEELIEDLKLPLAPLKRERRKRYIFRSSPRRWPLSSLETLRAALLFFRHWLFRSVQPREDETIEKWGERVAGEPFVKYLLSPALQGIYAGDVRRMSAELVIGRFFKKQKKHKPHLRGTLSPDRGMGQLIEELTEWLKRRGVQFHLGEKIDDLNGPTVIATSAWQAAAILRRQSPDMAKILDGVDALPLISATLFFQSAPEQARGFGCLFPSDQKFNSLGVLFNTDIFERRGRGRSETWILGGALHPELLGRSDEEVVALILDDRVRLFSRFDRPVETVIQRWPRALPHYTVELKHALERIQLPDQVFLTGNYLGRIGLSRILELNSELAEKIAGGHA
jgi:oxygen-dependent protoporphyrinogen oxidase